MPFRVKNILETDLSQLLSRPVLPGRWSTFDGASLGSEVVHAADGDTSKDVDVSARHASYGDVRSTKQHCLTANVR